MKILYVIKSCEKNLKSKASISENTWIKQINKNSDYIIMSANSLSDRIIGYGTNDDYRSTSNKLYHLLKNYDFNNFEWVFYLDDDCFCFPDRLEKYIKDKNLNYNEKIAVGDLWCYHEKIKDGVYCGGGGILISIKTLNILKKYTNDNDNILIDPVDDIALSYWFTVNDIKKINGNHDLANRIFDCTGYNKSFKFRNDNAICLHYCNSDDKIFIYNQYYSNG
jgi:hypothetical protein